MKPERLSGAICFVAVVVFLLHSASFLSPYWFKAEIEFDSESNDVHVDGIWWSLPGTIYEVFRVPGTGSEESVTGSGETDAVPSEVIREDNKLPSLRKRRKRSIVNMADNLKSTTKTPPGLTANNVTNKLPVRPIILEILNPSRTTTTPIPFTPGAITETVSATHQFHSLDLAIQKLNISLGRVKFCTKRCFADDIGDYDEDMCNKTYLKHLSTVEYVLKNIFSQDDVKGAPFTNLIPNVLKAPREESTSKMQNASMTNFKPDAQDTSQKNLTNNQKTVARNIAYMSAGLWYGTICVDAQPLKSSVDVDARRHASWCMLYIRTYPFAPEGIRNMFEIRLEASIGTGFALLTAIISSTCCCSRRHYLKRTVTSIVSLFISGAVMAVPVVYTFVRHMTPMTGPRRKWEPSMHAMFSQHELFEHYSAILAGISSLLAVILSVVFTGCLACGNKTPGNQYNFRQKRDHKIDDNEKHELPTHWLRNSKGAISSMTSLTEQTKLPFEDTSDKDTRSCGYEDIVDQSSVRDGGESLEAGTKETSFHDDSDPDVLSEPEVGINLAYENSDEENSIKMEV